MNTLKNKPTIFTASFLTFSLLIPALNGQTGGTGTYKFLELPVTARGASLGGKNISINDNDINLANMNPALLGPQSDNNISLSYINYYGEIGYGYVAWAQNHKSTGTFSLAMQYMDYGKFQEANTLGTKTGNFYASDYAFYAMYSYPIDSQFSAGISLKPLYSVYERYTSFGLAADVGITFTQPDGSLTVAAAIRNTGFQITKYSNSREQLPLDIILGVTKKLLYAPFRISVTAHSLQKPELRPRNKPSGESDPFAAGEIQDSRLDIFADNLFRHIIGAIEFVPSKTFYVGLAYNYQRRQDMALDDNPGMVGFSFGGGFRTKRFALSYGRSVLHISGGANFFSLTVNLNRGF